MYVMLSLTLTSMMSITSNANASHQMSKANCCRTVLGVRWFDDASSYALAVPAEILAEDLHFLRISGCFLFLAVVIHAERALLHRSECCVSRNRTIVPPRTHLSHAQRWR
jgi:hypothetical protein